MDRVPKSPTTGQVYSKEFAKNLESEESSSEITPKEGEQTKGLSSGGSDAEPVAIDTRKAVPLQGAKVDQIRRDIAQFISNLFYQNGERTSDTFFKHINDLFKAHKHMLASVQENKNHSLYTLYKQLNDSLVEYCVWLKNVQPLPIDKKYAKASKQYASHDKKFHKAADKAPIRKGAPDVGLWTRHHLIKSLKFQTKIIPPMRDAYTKDLTHIVESNFQRNRLIKAMNDLHEELQIQLHVKGKPVLDTESFQKLVDDWGRVNMMFKQFPDGHG